MQALVDGEVDDGGDDAPARRGTAAGRAVVDWSGERQRIHGFGGSFAFHKAGSIHRLGEPLASQMLDMLFDDVTGIGLNIVRVAVGDGGVWGDDRYDGAAPTIEPEPGVFVWNRPDWRQRKENFDAYQVWLMRQARARGVQTILATAWSPPAWMKQNNSTAGVGARPNRLRSDMYQAFADYLAEYVLGYERELGLRITHISPANEPDLSTSYSSCLWTGEELRDFVRDHLGPTFERRGVQAQIVLGETVLFDERLVRPTLVDPVASRYVDVVAAHAYTGLTDNETRVDPSAFCTSQELGRTIWQTEYMNQGSPRNQEFANNTISDGLRYATLIGNLFDETRLSAFLWWWPVANNASDGADLIRLVNTGSPQAGRPTENGQYRVFKRYYAIGQYSRFLHPGGVMIGATREPEPGVVITAYKDEAADHFAIVVVNNNADEVKLAIDLVGGFPLAGASVVPYRTSSNENMRRLADIPVTDGTVTTTLRAGSVTTFVPVGSALPSLPDRKDVFSTYLAAENDGQSPGLDVVPAPGRGAIVTGVRDGSYLCWTNVNFADGSAGGLDAQRGHLRLQVAVAARNGGRIDARIDRADGPIVATVEVPPGPGTDWTTVTTTVDTSPPAANGFHDLYLVFSGGQGPLLDVHQLSFSD